MSTHTEYVLNTIYYNKTVNEQLYKTRMSIYAHYGYPLKGLRSRNFAAFSKDENDKIFMYDYEPLKNNKYFIELMRNYYKNKVIKQSFVENIEGDIKKYIANHVDKIELGIHNLNGSTLLHDMIMKNTVILNQIYTDAQNECILEELNGPCQIS